MSQTVDLVKPKVWPMIAFFFKMASHDEKYKSSREGKKNH